MKFHPDKFKEGDMRQKVEAEEKFELIIDMKYSDTLFHGFFFAWSYY